MKLSGVIAVAALVATASAEGESLREVIAARLRANQELTSELEASAGVPPRGGLCRAAQRSKSSRKCENPDLIKPSCTCNERCHVWGDPHLRPFYFGCPFKTMYQPGTYTLWRLPEGKNAEVHFEIGVGREAGHPWSKQLFLNGELLLDADRDCEAGNFPKPIQDSIMLFSDEQNVRNGEDVTVEYYAACREKTNGRHRSVKQIEVVIDVKQTSENQATSSLTYRGVQDSTTFFANDEGYCTDPKSEKYECGRQSGLESFKGAQTGQKCSCETHCAVFGDPYFFDMYTDHSKASYKTKKSIIEPKNRREELGDTILYSVGDRFAVEIEMDECEFIEKARIYMLKESSAYKQLESCNAPKVASFTASDYVIQEYSAPELCSDEDVLPDSRHMITVPDMMDYSESDYADTEGYSLGRYIEVETETDAQLGTRTNMNKLVPVSHDTVDYKEVRSCMKSKGYGLENARKMVNLGGVKVNLKCHRSKGNKKGEFKKYFNICIEKTGIEYENYTVKENKNVETRTSNRSGRILMGQKKLRNMEEAARSFGYCATGEATNPRTRNPRVFEYRPNPSSYSLPTMVTDRASPQV